jgi:hypothetical protein
MYRFHVGSLHISNGAQLCILDTSEVIVSPMLSGPWAGKEENWTMVVLAHLVLPQVALDSLTITSILIAVVGTLYLAYDLLGRQHGPLQWLTLLMTGGFVSALVLGLVGTILYLLVDRSFSLPFTLQALVIGGLMGVFTVALVDLPKSQVKPRIVSGKGGAIGLALGLLFFFTVYFILYAGVLTAIAMAVTCVALASLWPYLTWDPSPSRPRVFSGKGFVIGWFLGFLLWFVLFFLHTKNIVLSVLISVPPALVFGGLMSLWRFIHWEESNPVRHVFSRKGFQVGFVIGYIPWLVFWLTQQNYFLSAQQHVIGLLEGLQDMGSMFILVILVGAFALASAAAGSLSQYMLWKANTLPLRLLGAFGLVLILLGFGLQAVPSVMDLISILGTPK